MVILFDILRRTLISSSVLIMAVLLLRLILRRAPKWVNCALWALVALRLVVPVFPGSPFSIVPKVEDAAVSAYSSVTEKSAPSDTQTDETQGLTPVQQSVQSDRERVLEVSAEKHKRWEESLPQRDVLGLVLFFGYPAGVIAMLAYGFISFAVLKRKLRTAVPVEKGVKKSEFISSPFVMGFFRSVIYLPSSLDEKNVAYVLAHERAHIRRGDNRFKVIAFLILSLYWFDPLVWISFVLFCRDMEAACDEKTVRDMSEDDRRGYARALLECSVSRRTVPACPVAFGETGVKQRVKNAVKYKKPAVWLTAAAAVICGVCAVCFLTDDSVADNGDFPGEYGAAVSSLVIADRQKYRPLSGEDVIAEGHHIYGAEKKDGVIKIYATVGSTGFSFINGYFTGGAGVTPVVITLPENCDPAQGHLEYPIDGEYWSFSIDEMIPYSLRRQMRRYESADRDAFWRQMTADAQRYLDGIGRTAEIKQRSELGVMTLSGQGVSDAAQERICELFPERFDYPIYGTEERVTGGTRIVYSTLYYPEYNEVVFRKADFASDETLAIFVFDAVTGERRDASQANYPEYDASWDERSAAEEWTTAAFVAPERDVSEADAVPAETAETLSFYISFRDAFASSPEDALRLCYPDAVSSPGQDGLTVSGILYSEFTSLMLRYFTEEFYEQNFGAAFSSVNGRLACISGGGTGMYEELGPMVNEGDMTCLLTVYNKDSGESYDLLATMEKHGEFHRLAAIRRADG